MDAPLLPVENVGRDRRRTYLGAVAIVAATVLAYLGSFSGVWVLDDEPGILRNTTIRDLGAIGRVLSPPADTTVSGRPVGNLTFALNHAFGGTEIGGYHAVNLCIHLLAALALFGVVRRTLVRVDAGSVQRATPVAFAGALLWALHPLQTEAVTYVVQRVESLMALFFLLTFYCFIRSLDAGKPRGWRLAAVVACLLGMASKEVMVVAPVLLVVYDRIFVAGSFRGVWAQRRGFHLALASTWVLLLGLVASTGWNRGGTVGFDVGVSAGTYWLSQFEAVARYLGLAFWPYPQVFDYATTSAREAGAIVAFAVPVLVLAGATAWALRRRPGGGFLGACFFAILAPTLVVPSAEQVFSEHRMYLPLAAVVVAVVATAWGRWGRGGLWAVLALAPVLGWCTAQRNTVYRSERGLWEDTVAKRPDNDRAHLNLGNILARAGEFEAALGHFRTAVRLNPMRADAQYNLGTALKQTGRFDRAIAAYEKALDLDPRLAEAECGLGAALVAAGRGAEAVFHFEKALRIDPQNDEAHNRLGIANAEAGRFDVAIEHFRGALRANPARADVHNNLGDLLRAGGRLPESITHYEQALRIDPQSAPSHRNLGRALAAMGRTDAAVAALERAVRLAPAAADVRGDLGMVLVMGNRAREAIGCFEAALRLDPQRVQLHLYLAVALEQVGRVEEAQAQLEIARREGVRVPGQGE